MPQKRATIARSSVEPTARMPRMGWIGSALLHGAILAAMLFTFQHKLDIADEAPPVVPVDLVTLAKKTSIAPQVREKPKEEAPAPTPPTPPAPQQKVEPAPAPPKAEPAPPKEAVAKPQPQKTEPAPAPKPKAQAPAKPVKKEEKFDINNIAALLDKRQAKAAAPKNARLGQQTFQGIGSENAMTMDLVDALRNQIAQCWSPPVGAPHPDQLIVTYELFLNPDGSVAQPPQLTGSVGDPFMRAAADAARRAIYTCAPYKLPADRYAQWRDITLVFDPRKMVGQ